MQLFGWIDKKGTWLSSEGHLSDVVISSRIRLARDIKGIPYPPRARQLKKDGTASLKASQDKVMSAAKTAPDYNDATFLDLQALDRIDRQFLIERHVISHQFASEEGPRMVIVGASEQASLMINEEDHLRLQRIMPGLDLDNAWKYISATDDYLSSLLDYAFRQDLGHLTACPTNAGTGMRASCLMHLPGLVLTNQINQMLKSLSQIGVTARGLYGEGTRVFGDLFQISNSFTLGVAEEEILDNIDRVVRQIVSREMDARQMLASAGGNRLEEKIYQATKNLSQAREIGYEETIDLLSKVRLGISLKMDIDIPRDRRLVTELMFLAQPAHIQEMQGKELTPSKRDFARAALLRSKLSS